MTIETDGLVAELRDALRDLLPYIDDPAYREWPGGGMSVPAILTSRPSTIDAVKKQLADLERKAEVVARAKRLVANRD